MNSTDKISLRAKLVLDYEFMQLEAPCSLLRYCRALTLNPGLLCVTLIRLQQYVHSRERDALASLLRQVNHILTGADVLPGAQIGLRLNIQHPNGLVIGRGVVVGERTRLLQGVTLGERLSGRDRGGYPTVGDGCVIGAGAVVVGSIRIGNNVHIGSNAVVTADVPPFSVARGVPARVWPRTDTSTPAS